MLVKGALEENMSDFIVCIVSADGLVPFSGTVMTQFLSCIYTGPGLEGMILTHWGRGKMDAILKCIFLNENAWIPIEIWLKFVPKGPIDNIPALV